MPSILRQKKLRLRVNELGVGFIKAGQVLVFHSPTLGKAGRPLKDQPLFQQIPTPELKSAILSGIVIRDSTVDVIPEEALEQGARYLAKLDGYPDDYYWAFCEDEVELFKA